MSTSETGALGPPYGPWSAFFAFLKKLGESVVPNTIDGSLFRGQSGSSQAQLRGALRFFGLVGEKNETKDRLRKLVEATKDPEVFKAQLKTLLDDAYGPIYAGVDMQSGTRGQLEQAFREKGGVTGSVNQKALRFFLTASAEVGDTYSPHFTSPGVQTDNGTRKAAKARKKAAPAGDDGGGGGSGGGSGSGGGRAIDPALHGLLEKLPPEGEPLSAGRRKALKDAFSNFLDFIYPEEEPK